MKRLLLASILMAFGTSAYALPTLQEVTCDGAGKERFCTASVICNNRFPCTIRFIALASFKCVGTPLNQDENGDNASYFLVASREGNFDGSVEPHPVCAWDVTDEDGTARILIDDTSTPDGLPVELQSLSVE
jgi:hypothetical protein